MILSEKYRPTSLDQIKSQPEIINILKYIIEHDECNINLLFYGISGIGKTSCILSFANDYYENHKQYNVLELNASANRGIETVRNVITDFISSKTLSETKHKKLIILDEADNMTHNAQILIASLMEQYNDVIFCFICNYINKIDETVYNRCLSFRFNKISLVDTRKILKNIITKEKLKINLAPDVYKQIYEISDGDLRKCINILQLLNENKNITDVSKFMRVITTEQFELLITHLNEKNSFMEKFKKIKEFIESNDLKLKNIITHLTKYIIKNKLDKNIIKKLATIENNIVFDYNFDIQLCSIISLF